MPGDRDHATFIARGEMRRVVFRSLRRIDTIRRAMQHDGGNVDRRLPGQAPLQLFQRGIARRTAAPYSKLLCDNLYEAEEFLAQPIAGRIDTVWLGNVLVSARSVLAGVF